MPNNCQAHRYQEIEINTATPVELVVLLYDAAMASLQKAQEHIATGEIEKRTRCLNKATSIITELQANLNFASGGSIAPSLDRLYLYMKNRIFQANLQQNAAPVKEIVKLLNNLREAWAEISRKETREPVYPKTALQGTAPAVPLPAAGSAESRTALASLNLTA
jgi:flagellar secretion chaperone FliS